jgi:ABC-type Fe3+/spermidine/putrescine transport system ATPase subunit
MTRVILEGLVKRYGRVAAVDGVSLDIKPGELVYVLGPSGAGKSTLARLIAGLKRPDDGEIYFEERVVHTLPPAQRRVGMVVEDDALWPRLTIAGNVEEALRLQGVPRKERRDRVAEALNAVAIDSLAGKRPGDLSAAQQQRAALARALAIRPEVLILDEPLGRLDIRASEELRDEIRRLQSESEITTIVLSRQPREALALADRLAVMDLGRIVQFGLPQDVYNRPADTFVARFLGPTNLLQGHVDATDVVGALVIRTPFGRLIGQSVGGALARGTPVMLSIRPESLWLGPAVPPDSNRFPATVERLTFLGALQQVHLRGPGDWPVLALALQTQTQGLREGQSLTVSVAPENVVVLSGKYAVPK